MSKGIESQLQSLHASQKYFVWVNYYLSPLPLSNNDVQKLKKKNKKPYYQYFNLKSVSKDTISKIKSDLSQCESQNQIETIFKKEFELMNPIGNEINLIKYAKSSNLQAEKKEIRSYIENEIMTILISISVSFEADLYAIRENLPNERFSPELWNLFYLFIDYFNGAKEKVFLDFLIVIEPIIAALNEATDLILKLDETKLAFTFLKSIIDPLYKCLQIEHKVKKQSNLLILSFFVNLVKGVLHYSHFQLFNDSLNKFFELEFNYCLELSKNDQNLLAELSKEFILRIQESDFKYENDDEKEKAKKSLFQIGFNCSKINMLLCKSVDNSYITFSIDFVIWSISTFPIDIFKFPQDSTIKRPIKRIQIDSPIEMAKPETVQGANHSDNNSNDIKSKHKTPNPISYLCSNEQLNDLYNHLINIRPIYAEMANKDIVYSHLSNSYNYIDLIQNKHVFIAFSIVLLKKVPNIKAPDGTFQFIFEPSVFTIPNDAPEGKPPNFSQLDRLTSNFIMRLQAFIFKFAKKACVLADGRRTILSSLGEQLNNVKNNENEMYYYIQNILPLLKIIRFFDLTVFGIVDNLLEFMNSHLDTDLGIQLFQFIQLLIIRNPTLYFSKATIIDQFTMNSKNAFFTPCIYNTLISSLKYCSARKEFANLFEDVLRHIAKCLLDEYKMKSESAIDVIKSFMVSIKELNLSPFYQSHFPGEIVHVLIEIPKLMKRDDVLIDNLNFMKDINCISNRSASDTLATSLKEVKITSEIIDILMFIIFEEKVKLKDEKILSKAIIKNSFGLKPLMMATQDTKYEDDVLLFIFNIMTYNKNRYNSLQCSNGDVVRCALSLYLKKQKEICMNIIILIIGINPSPSSLESIYEIIKDLSKEENQELNNSIDLTWLTDFLCKLSNEIENDSSIYVDLISSIKDIQINGSSLGKKFTVSTVVSLKEDEKSTLFEICGSNNTTYIAYYENSVFHVKVEGNEKNFVIDFPNSSKKLILKWKVLNFAFSQHSVSLNKEKVHCDLPLLPEQCKLNIGSSGVQFSSIKLEPKQKQKYYYELASKSYKEPYLYFSTITEKNKEQSLNEISFDGFITYCESITTPFKSSNLFTSFFGAMMNKKYFKSLLTFFNDIFVIDVQESFYEKNAITELVDALEKASDYITPDCLKTLYSIYSRINDSKIKNQYLINVLMNPSLFMQAQYPTALEYCEKILPDLSSSYRKDFYNFFNENENFNRFFEGILTMQHDDSDSEKLVNVIWPLFQNIFIKKHSLTLYKTFIVAMGKCKNHYFAYNAILFFAEKISQFYTTQPTDSPASDQRRQTRTMHFSRKSDPEKLNDEQKSDYELQKALSEKESFPMFILIFPLVPDQNKRICLKCLGDLAQYTPIESGYFTNEVFSILNKFEVEPDNALSLVSDCMNLMFNYSIPEMLPLISYLSSFLPTDEASKAFQKFINSLNESIINEITIVPFWIYWTMLFYRNTLKAKGEITLGKDIKDKFFGLPFNRTIVSTAFATFDTLTIFNGFDFHEIKEDIIKFYLDQIDTDIFEPEKSSFDENIHADEQAQYLELMSLLFTLLVVQIKPENENNNKDKFVYTYDTNALKRCYELRDSVNVKNVIFDVRVEKGKSEDEVKWLDLELAKFFIEKITPPASCRIQYKLYWNHYSKENKFYIPVQKALGYIISIMIKVNKSSISVPEIKDIIINIEPRADGEIVHDIIGMILSSYGIKDIRQQLAPNEDIQALYDIYDVIHDDKDSPDLDLFIFEDYVESHTNELLKNSLLLQKKK
ncbi:hypothetical protein M9Y10_025447 [Tritrichomonas musculus]|uniref:HECT domain-containing protein n=1 Tax=Tritrichomonas musculus TaxID=1915356 RepID=A0ABR2H8P5_9EUKA